MARAGIPTLDEPSSISPFFLRISPNNLRRLDRAAAELSAGDVGTSAFDAEEASQKPSPKIGTGEVLGIGCEWRLGSFRSPVSADAML